VNNSGRRVVSGRAQRDRRRCCKIVAPRAARLEGAAEQLDQRAGEYRATEHEAQHVHARRLPGDLEDRPMTAVGPLPPGFSPIEADSLPAPPPEAPAATAPAAPYQNPLEAWATEPGQPFEPTIRRDLHPSGYLSASALRILEQGIARERAWGRTAADEPVILHASQIEARKRQAEQAAEAERKTRDPRAALQQAHQLRAEAVAEVERLQAPVERVHELVRSLEGRGREHEAEVKARQAAAAAALTRALAAGEPVLPLVEALNTATDPIAAELATARAALAQLEAQAKAAADRLARCHAGVARNAIAVLVDRAIDEAVSIVEAEAADAGANQPGALSA
jgi:hypothetical protein